MSEAIEVVRDEEDGIEHKSRSVGEFVGDVRDEMKHVSFPSSDEVRNITLIVIINVIFFATFLFVVDSIWVYFLQAIEWLFKQIGF